MIYAIDTKKFSKDMLVFRYDMQYTRSEFAPLVGTSKGTIQNIENNRQIPSAEVLYNFCMLTGKDINQYFITKS